MARLLLVHRTHGTLPVVAAMRTHTVGRLWLVALRAQAGCRRTQCVVRAPFGGSRLGVSTFRIRHSSFLLLFRRSDLDITKSGPAFIDKLGLTLARAAGISIQPTQRANPLAFFLADLLHG